MLLNEGQTSNYNGAAFMIDALPRARAPQANRGNDAGWFRAALDARGIAACIASHENRKIPNCQGTVTYRRCDRIDNMFGTPRNRCRVHARYDRCAHLVPTDQYIRQRFASEEADQSNLFSAAPTGCSMMPDVQCVLCPEQRDLV